MSLESSMGQPVNYTPEVRLAANILKRPLPEIVNLSINAVNPLLTNNKIPLLVPDPAIRRVNRADPAMTRLLNQYPSTITATRAAATVTPGALNDPGNMRLTFRTVSNPQTGQGYTIEGLGNDRLGRPVILTKPALSAFDQMIKDSGGVVKASDVESSQRSTAHNITVGGASASPHLGGNALDIHGKSKEWMIKNGARYGWYLIPYPGSHGGHFEYRPN